MHSVLSLPELLDFIFSSLDRKSNANNASVCRIWSEPALNHIWHDVEKVEVLLRLLGTLNTEKKQDSGCKTVTHFVRRFESGILLTDTKLTMAGFQKRSGAK